MLKKSVIPLPSRLLYCLVFAACWLFGLLPRWFLYGPVAEGVYLLLYRVARYRVGVVRENLAASFPERSEAQRRAIEGAFYHNLAEYFLDAIDLGSITRRGLRHRCDWPADNRAEVNELAAGRNWIVLSAHFGSWELQSTFALWPDAPAMVSAYRPLSNRTFDLYFQRVRNHLPDICSVPSGEIARYFLAHRGEPGSRPLAAALIADQYPHLDPQSWWVPFLGQPTAFFHGGEKLARRYGVPVFVQHIEKIGRGRWRQRFEMIWDGVSPIADHYITDTYARLLEEDIRRTPELWLWSHRRWKLRPTGNAAADYNERYGTDIPIE